MTKSPFVVQGEAADELARPRVEGHDVRALHALPALGHASADAAERSRERRRAVDVGDPGDVVGLERAVGDVAARERDRKHHRLGGNHAAAAADELGLAERRVRQAEQVPDLVQRDRLDVEAIRSAGLGRRPGKDRVEVDVRLEDAPVGLVDGEGRRGEGPILPGLAEVSDDVRAVLDKRPRLHEADERRRGLGVLDGVPGAEGARHGGLELLGGHAGRRRRW